MIMISGGVHFSNLSHSEQASLWNLPQPAWDENLDFETIEFQLLYEDIVDICNIDEYLSAQNRECGHDNVVQIVLLKNGLKAVFKSICYYPEAFAYRAAVFLGHRFVPPTVIRVINGRIGSLQFLIEPCFDFLSTKASTVDLEHDLKSDIQAFSFVFGRWDIDGSNQLVQINNGKAYVALIDNAPIYNLQQVHYGDYPFVRIAYSDLRNDDFDEPFPFDKSISIKNFSYEEAFSFFGEFLEEKDLKNFHKRYSSIGVTFCYWRNSLWVQYYKDHPEYSPCCAPSYNSSTIDAYKCLSYEVLTDFFKEALVSPEHEHYEKLIPLILERRDQLIAHSRGTFLQPQ